MASNVDENFVPAILHFLPPGVRFFPAKGDLIEFFLKKKILGQLLPIDCVPTLEVYSMSPDQLPLPTDEWRVRDEWYFFTTKRNTDSVIPTIDGFYSVITEDQIIKQEDETVGFMTTMAYFQGRPPEGKKSKWTFFEFRVKPDTIPAIKHDDALKAKVSSFVVCKFVRESKKPKRKLIKTQEIR